MHALPKDAQCWYAMEASDSNMQSPYCSDACWYEHEKDGRVGHGPADTKAWAEDTTNSIWRRGRLKEADVDPRGVGTLQVHIKIGDPLSSIFHQLYTNRRASRRSCS
jgi:hypothetical protein